MALVPEVRVNKHGVPVVKHVNPDRNTASTQPMTVPMPSVSPNEDLSHTQWMIKGSLRNSGKHKRECDSMRKLLHPDTLRFLQERMEKSMVVYNVTRNLINRSLEDGSFIHLNNLMVVLDGMPDSGQHYGFSLSEHVVGLQARTGGTKKDWSKKDKNEWVKPQTLVKAIHLLDQPYLDHTFAGTGTFIRSRALESLILERPSDTERITALVTERQFHVDTEDEIASLVELLDQKPETAIAGGIL